MFRLRTCVVACAIGAASLCGSSAGAAMIVNSSTYGTAYEVFTAETGGRTLIQEFFISTRTTVETLEFYGWAADAEFALLRDIGSTIRQEDEIWRTSFSDMNEGWHDLGGPQTLGPGTYYLVMESNSADLGDASWFRALATSRVGLGAFSVALSQPDLYAASNIVNTFTFGSMAMRIQGLEVPTPGAVSLAGLAGLTLLRRRR